MSNFIKLAFFIIAVVTVVVLVGPIVIFVGAILTGVIFFAAPVIILFTGVWFIWLCMEEHSKEFPKKK